MLKIIYILIVLFCICAFTYLVVLPSVKKDAHKEILNSDITSNTTPKGTNDTNNVNNIIPTPAATPDPTIDVNTNTSDKFSLKELYKTATNGRVWFSNWGNGKNRTLQSGDRDPFDAEFISRGNGTTTIDGQGSAHLTGDAPRMYVYDAAKIKKWNNVEVTVYAKRISETGKVSSQGIVIGARSEHQDATADNPCLGRTYYGRLLYDGRAVFQKEVIHEGAYSVNKPEENHKALWNTKDGTMPYNKWIGVKFVAYTNADHKSVKLELYRDLTEGLNGGTWEKVAEYTDDGAWSQTDTGADVKAKCGYSAGKVLLDPGTSVFIRNDNVSDVQYKMFSIREITP